MGAVRAFAAYPLGQSLEFIKIGVGPEIESYLASGEWRGKAGGYGIQGIAGSFVVKMVGSYSNVVGLPLYETISLLTGEGYDVHFKWAEVAR